MPQIVEVLKYVHEVTEKEELGVAVGGEIGIYEQRLKILSKDIKVTFDLLLTELRKLLKSNPNFKLQIELIEKFLLQFEEYLLYPKIFSVPKEKIV
jgi:hypothetical protein